jgi:four helix bundle protein
MAHASGGELETQVEIARRIQIVGAAEAANLISSAQEVARMLNGLVSSLEPGR